MLVPFSPPPGINSDDTTFSTEGRWANGDGFRFRHGKAETLGGVAEMSSATAIDRVTNLLVFDQGGTISLAVAGDTLRVGGIDAAGTDITPASGWTSGSVLTRRSLAMWGDTLLVSQSGGKLFESAAAAQATEVTAAPDQITKMIVTPSRQVMALGCNEETSGTFNPRCIRWCDIEDYDDWTTTSTNNAGEYILPGQEDIISGTVFGDVIMIWTEGSLWLAEYLGYPDQTFQFVRVGNVGIVGLDAHASYRQTLYWVGPDRGIYAYRLGAIVQRIPCPVSRHFIDNTTNYSIWACAVSANGEIWFGITTNTGTPDRYYVYCVDESETAGIPVWFMGTFQLALDEDAAGAMIDSPLLAEPLGSYRTTTIVYPRSSNGAVKPYRWDCNLTSSFPLISAIPGAYIQTADFYIDNTGRRMLVKRIIPDFEEQTGAIYLTAYTRDGPLAEPLTKGPFTVATSSSLATCRVNDTVASGDAEVTVDNAPEAMAAGVKFTFSGVNGYDGGDTGALKQFTVTEDFIGGDGTLYFTPAVVNSGASRNVVNLPADNAAISGVTRAWKKDFRATGKVFAFKFETAGNFKVRFGKTVFDVTPLGGR